MTYRITFTLPGMRCVRVLDGDSDDLNREVQYIFSTCSATRVAVHQLED